jgi:hypothetical protein
MHPPKTEDDVRLSPLESTEAGYNTQILRTMIITSFQIAKLLTPGVQGKRPVTCPGGMLMYPHQLLCGANFLLHIWNSAENFRCIFCLTFSSIWVISTWNYLLISLLGTQATKRLDHSGRLVCLLLQGRSF